MSKSQTPEPQKSTAVSVVEAVGELPIKTLLALLIPILLFGGCCFTLMVGMVASEFGEPIPREGAAVETDPQEPPSVAEPILPQQGEEPAELAKMKVIVFDDTVNRPIPAKAEIWFRGLGSWWLANDTGPKTVGPRPLGELLSGDETLVLYPVGRGKNEQNQRINVPIKLTREMHPQGSDRDALTIEVSDSSISIWGLPVKAATGTSEVVFPRK